MKYEKYNSIQYVSNNWKANTSNSINSVFNGLLRIKHKKPSAIKRYHLINGEYIHILSGDKIKL